MKIEIEAPASVIHDLVAAIDGNANLEPIKNQLLAAIALDNHDQSDEVPKEGDDPIIERSE